MNPTHSETCPQLVASHTVESHTKQGQPTATDFIKVTISPDKMTVYSSDDAPSWCREDDAKPVPPENAQQS